MSVKTIQRTQCAVTGATDLEPLYCFKDFPVFMGCTSNPQSDDVTADMDWVISRESGVIQLSKLLPLDVLYPEAHGAGCVGGLWQAHHSSFADFIREFAPAAILEIGGSHGILSREYHQRKDIPWTIIEPNPTPVEGCRAKFIRGFFDDSFRLKEDCDTLVHSHVFEHIYEPDLFMSHISGFMKDGMRLIFSLPNMQVMLERKYTNCINFEHTVYLTEPYVEHLLAKHGFELERKEYFKDDHSIFYTARKSSATTAAPLPAGLYEKNKSLYLEYLDYHHKLIDDLNQKIQGSSRPVFLFGAHVFAQYLLGMGLSSEKIESLLDNDKNKQGKRLYGTPLSVNSPQVLREIESPCVILKAGVYNDEIRRDILENINPNTVFWE